MKKELIIEELLMQGYTITPPRQNKITNDKSAYEQLKKYATKKQEHVVLLSLDNQNNIIGHDVIFIGTVKQCHFSPREIFMKALKRGAVNIIISHNHPSGSTEPSGADIKVTQAIIRSGDTLDIRCIDHIIVSINGFTSLRAQNPELWDSF